MSAFVECGHCGMFHAGPCPRIKAIEYFPNGMLKRVEYVTEQPKLVESPFKGTVTMFPPPTT